MTVDTVIRQIDLTVEEQRHHAGGVGHQGSITRSKATYRFEPGDGCIDLTVIREEERRPAARSQLTLAEATSLVDALNSLIAQAARNGKPRGRA